MYCLAQRIKTSLSIFAFKLCQGKSSENPTSIFRRPNAREYHRTKYSYPDDGTIIRGYQYPVHELTSEGPAGVTLIIFMIRIYYLTDPALHRTKQIMSKIVPRGV